MFLWVCILCISAGLNLTMKNKTIKNVIFDLGAVMFEWNPQAITSNFTDDPDLQQRILSDFYYHQTWMDFDCGHITENEAIKRASENLLISEGDAKRLLAQTKESLVLIADTRNVLTTVKDKNMNAYCLSNISPELFEYLSHRHDLFEQFDGIVTSGVENVSKPGKRIFEILFERFKLNPRECLFIDDSADNTATAEEFGVTTITFKGSADCYRKISAYI